MLVFRSVAVGLLFACVLLQRLPLVVLAWFATTRALGTHLDTSAVTDIHVRPFGERQLADAFDAWLWPTAIPNATVWVFVTVVAGIVLGIVPYWLGRRRK